MNATESCNHDGMVQERTQELVAVADVATFQADGAVVVRGLLDEAELELLAAGIDANLAAPSQRAKVASSTDDPGLFIEDFCTWTVNPAYERVIRESAIGAVAAQLMGSTTARLYHDHLLVKEAGTRQPTPWHQDQPYYNVEGRQNVSFWIPVDPVPLDATLWFVAGSHLGPWLMPRTFLDAQAKWFPEGSLAELPPIDPATHRIVGWELQPGDAVAFHMLTLHSSAGSATRRRVFSVRLLGDDMVHAPRAWVTSPDFPGLAAELPAGAPLEHPLFPLVHPELPT
jgi:ectoine hydroxylase-related dioxygenase (phytanoyl-CoA dioxygenase family)